MGGDEALRRTHTVGRINLPVGSTMASDPEDELCTKPVLQAETQRVLLSLGEYPGSPPTLAEVERSAVLRQDGNARYADGVFEEALRLYSAAAILNPSDHLIYSNRSACLLRMGRAIDALDDAELCVALAPTFARGFLRKGSAEQALNRRVDAQASFARGLFHDADNNLLKQATEALRADSSCSLQSTLYHVLFVSPHLQMDRLFQVLEDPDRLTATYVKDQAGQLDAQFACLTQTLRVDLGLLFASPVLRDAYDRVTFACGQLLQWAPEAVTKHLQQAQRIVQGLGLALRCGWSIHHGVAKFSANALTVLATCEGAKDELRREAVRLLLGGLLRWLLDPTREPEVPPEDRGDRDVCGCSYLSPRLSAATWLERLFEHGTRPWVSEECERFPGILQLVTHLCLVVRDERAVPLGLPCLLRLPLVARLAMECEAVVDLTTSNRDSFGRREGRRWMVRQRVKNNTVGTAADALAPPSPSAPPSRLSAAVPEPAVAASRGASMPGGGDVFKPCGASSSGLGPSPPGQAVSSPRTAAPSQRLGEWLMASLGYLLVFVDDDALFAAHSCSALSRLANATPDGVARLTEGVWMGLPMLERLSTLACQHTAALELLETLARHSGPARVAMLSLAAALVTAAPVTGTAAAAAELLSNAVDSTVTHGSGISDGLHVVPPDAGSIADPAAMRGGPSVSEAPAQANECTAPSSSSSAGAPASPEEAVSGREPAEGEHEVLGEPSWAECYHELHDELWIAGSKDASDGHGRPARFHGVVSLGNFCEGAPQVPVAGCLSMVLPWAPEGDLQEVMFSADDDCNSSSSSSWAMEVAAMPSVWNARFNDHVEARLEIDEPHVDIGTPAWRSGKEGSIVLLLRSSIQRSPATPDWAACVWLCSEVGARAAVVVNDMPDDGPVQPAFRMGLFGSPAPPIAAFMISGRDGAALRTAARRLGPTARLRVAVRSVRTTGVPILPAAGGLGLGSEGIPPCWPLVLRILQDVAQAWSLVETVHRAAPSAALGATLDALAQRMGLPEKRTWLTRRLQRYHRGDTDSDDIAEPALAFVECDREGGQLQQLRCQLLQHTGLAAPDITGELEVRFREESSVGSAVVREWMDLLARKAFLPSQHRILISYDGGVNFLPDPAAAFLNPQWRGDFEMLGRLVGLALWHQVTLDLPLHPYVCELLLSDQESAWQESPVDRTTADRERLRAIDPELCRHKVDWLLANDVSELGFGLPFTDVLLEAGTNYTAADALVALPASGNTGVSGTSASTTGKCAAVEAQVLQAAEAVVSALGQMPEVVTPEDALPGDRCVAEPLRLRAAHPSGTQVALVPGGQDREVSQSNKNEFVAKFLEWRLRGSMCGPIAAMVKGLHAAVPAAVLDEARRMLTPAEVHGLLAGMRDIDVEDWRLNTRMAGGISATAQEVRWFWQIVRHWAADGRQDRLQDLLQFATGSRRVPVGGFAQLVGFNGGKHLFTLAKGVHLTSKSLPTSHACICTVDLPPWETFEAAKHKLSAALDSGRGRFDEGHAAPARNDGT